MNIHDKKGRQKNTPRAVSYFQQKKGLPCVGFESTTQTGALPTKEAQVAESNPGIQSKATNLISRLTPTTSIHYAHLLNYIQ